MGESVCIPCIREGVSIQNIQRTHTNQYKKKTKMNYLIDKPHVQVDLMILRS